MNLFEKQIQIDLVPKLVSVLKYLSSHIEGDWNKFTENIEQGCFFYMYVLTKYFVLGSISKEFSFFPIQHTSHF